MTIYSARRYYYVMNGVLKVQDLLCLDKLPVIKDKTGYFQFCADWIQACFGSISDAEDRAVCYYFNRLGDKWVIGAFQPRVALNRWLAQYPIEVCSPIYWQDGCVYTIDEDGDVHEYNLPTRGVSV